MPHPKMRESIMTSPENTALAEEVLQCNGGIPKCYCGVGLVVHSFACPAAYRPAVALALQSKDDSAALEIDRLKGEIGKLQDRHDSLMESQYRAGLMAGWNMGIENDDERYESAMRYEGHLAALHDGEKL